MIRLGVIGLGSIFPMQMKALNALSASYQLVAVCDVAPDKRVQFDRTIRPTLSGISPRMYASADALFDDPEVDAVLIATPPATHFSLTQAGLRKRKAILLEKPAVLNTNDLVDLYAEADQRKSRLHIAFHASFAKDLEWFLSHAIEIAPAPIDAIECRFYDPYMQNGAVIPGKRSLGGCYIDSGVNALSVCARLTDLQAFNLETKTEVSEKDANGVVYEACHTFVSASQKITVKTGWNQGMNHKSTLLRFHGTDTEILLDHSNQQVIQRKRNSEEPLFRDASQERLLVHYCGVFQDFAESYSAGRDNREMAKRVHTLLFSDSSAGKKQENSERAVDCGE